MGKIPADSTEMNGYGCLSAPLKRASNKPDRLKVADSFPKALFTWSVGCEWLNNERVVDTQRNLQTSFW